jgi:septum formation protein
MHVHRPLILGSTSPRRQFLMKEIGFEFKVQKPDADESFPAEMRAVEVPKYLAEKKATSLVPNDNSIVLTADTVVVIDTIILNKPASREEAIAMLKSLAGRKHTVITAVCLCSKTKMEVFDISTSVTFRSLHTDDIEKYVDEFKPFDKAGAYGAQECLPVGLNPCSDEEVDFLASIGKSGLAEKSVRSVSTKGTVIIEKIDGSYFNVMGLPIHKVYDRIVRF